MRHFLNVIMAICAKDLRSESRTREIMSSMLVFALITILIFVFAFDLSVEMRQKAACGVIWVTLCFSGTLSLNRSVSIEKDREGMDGLLLAPVDHTAIFFGKALVNWIYMLITAVIIVPAYSLFNNVNLFTFAFIGVILLGTLGYVLTGTMLSTLSMQLKTRDMLLPVLLFPVMIPLLLASVNASNLVLQGVFSAELNTWLFMLIGYDLLFLSISIILYDKILEE